MRSRKRFVKSGFQALNRPVAVLLALATAIPLFLGIKFSDLPVSAAQTRDPSSYLELNYRFDESDLGTDSSGKGRNGGWDAVWERGKLYDSYHIFSGRRKY